MWIAAVYPKQFVCISCSFRTTYYRVRTELILSLLNIADHLCRVSFRCYYHLLFYSPGDWLLLVSIYYRLENIPHFNTLLTYTPSAPENLEEGQDDDTMSRRGDQVSLFFVPPRDDEYILVMRYSYPFGNNAPVR